MKRYEALDGLRGVAAIMVVAHHSSELFTGRLVPKSGYLAVDFFFMLSGFVLAAVYEPRFAAGMTPWAFAKIRLKCLYPTMAFGISLGALFTYFTAGPSVFWFGLFLAAILFIPVPLGRVSIFQLNAVQWSLMFEFLLNALHVGCLWKVTNRTLAILCGISLLWLVVTASQYGSLRLGDRGYSMLAGVPRALFPYVLGILIYRVRARLPTSEFPAWTFLIALAACFFAADAATILVQPWIVNLAIVVLVFPPMIHFGSLAVVGGLSRLCEGLGRMSYPLYAIHLPVVYTVAQLGARTATMAVLAILAAMLAAHLLAPLLVSLLSPGSRRRQSVTG